MRTPSPGSLYKPIRYVSDSLQPVISLSISGYRDFMSCERWVIMNIDPFMAIIIIVLIAFMIGMVFGITLVRPSGR